MASLATAIQFIPKVNLFFFNILFLLTILKLFSRESDTFRQFAKVDSGFLAWDFWLKDKDDRLLASINRNFRGIGRELFTDTGMSILSLVIRF